LCAKLPCDLPDRNARFKLRDLSSLPGPDQTPFGLRVEFESLPDPLMLNPKHFAAHGAGHDQTTPL
jgi:hypothetical protein